MAHIPRLLSLLDREAHSKSDGSFDREHWGWKFRDFPITMLQAAIYPLALVWYYPFPESPYYQNDRLFGWIQAAIENTCRRQHKNGAFDSVGPNTQDHGVTLAMAYTLAETLRALELGLARGLIDRVREVVRRSCEFALKSSEDYAFINNHQALFALAFLDAHELLGEERYSRQAEEIIERILHEQSSDGWYREYDGPDPGYESLGIFYLATYWRRARSERVLGSLRRAVEFYAHCVHPDGSVGGIYGSRHTHLYFPAGFEILGAEIPLAAAIARYMRERLALNNAVTPTVCDAENLPTLTYTYLEACLVPDGKNPGPIPQLPCEALEGTSLFPDSGISAVGNRQYYAVVSASKGGVCRIFDKRTAKIAYEDAGYLVRADKRLWTSQSIGLGRRVNSSRPNEFACETRLAEVRQELPTPSKFILLRLLNLTLFRSLILGRLVRRLVIDRLITAKRVGLLRFKRSIAFGQDEIRFHDRIELQVPMRVELVALPRSFMAIHMGSAKYFHPAELGTIPQAPVEGMVKELNVNHAAECEFALHFSETAGPGLVVAQDATERSAVREEELVRS